VGNGLYSNIVSGGKMKHIFYRESNKIYGNQFWDVQLEDIEVEMESFTFFKNELDSVVFRNIILKGQMEENNHLERISVLLLFIKDFVIIIDN